jgi:hypothetical protein
MGNHHFYGRDGKPILGGVLEWAKLFEDADYKIVSQTTLEDRTLVSTVWLGFDHNIFNDGPPIIFETMVFAPPGKEELERDVFDCVRYTTEVLALKGHIKMVAKWKRIVEEYKKAGLPAPSSRQSRNARLN